MGWCRPSCETAHTSGFFDPIVIVPRRWGGVCDEEHRLVVTKKEWGAGQFEKAISDVCAVSQDGLHHPILGSSLTTNASKAKLSH